MNFLLIDFGTTSIKTAIVNLDTGIFSSIQSHPAAPNCAEIPGHYEVSPFALKERFLSICDLYFNQLEVPFEGIVICSEKNGFMALNTENEPITNYISWKDERSLEPIDGISTFTLLTDQLGDRFKRLTGWRPGPGLPFMNVTHLARLARLKTPCKIVSLPEWLSLCCDDSNDVLHDTMLHGLTFYDVHRKKISTELIEIVEDFTGVKCTFNNIAPTGSIAGYWHSHTDKVPIYVAIGDHQCAVLGARIVPRETISINIGTGSQVAVISPPITPNEVELKPYFDSSILATVTRIPGGRSLASYIKFLEDICQSATGQAVDFWPILKEIDETDTLNATLKFDLGVFSSAWNYQGGGKISNIFEDSLTFKNYLSSLLRAFVEQYLEVMNLFDPHHQISRCLLSGGVPRRLPLLTRIISSLSGYETLPAYEIDESLVGLRTVALVSAKRAPSCFNAQEMFGQDSAVRQND